MKSSILAIQALVLGLTAAAPGALVKRATTTTTTSTTSATTAATVQTASPFVYAACAVEPFYNGLEARSLHGASQVVSSMTIELCAAYCASFNYFGVEYSSECYCGNTIHNGTTLDVSGGCNMACAGSSSEYCGGSGRMNFYQQSTISSALSLPTSYAVATEQSVSVTGWNYLTCVVEPAALGYPGVRALTDAVTYSASMTVEYCASFCAGYTYFGVEYSQGNETNSCCEGMG